MDLYIFSLCKTDAVLALILADIFVTSSEKYVATCVYVDNFKNIIYRTFTAAEQIMSMNILECLSDL